MYKLMFVDDDVLMTDSFLPMLNWQRLQLDPPLIANHYDQAVAMLSQTKVDILISDIEMFGKNGFELIAWCRKNCPETICIFLTCHARFDFAKRAIHLGVADYLLKPVQPSELQQLLQRCIDRLSNRSDSMEEKTYSEVVQQAMNYIQEHLSEVISRESLCSTLFVSERHLSRLFQQELGLSLTDYITACRIDRAKELLSGSQLSITDVSAQVGFNYPAYFTKVFRDKTGVTPVQYRRSHGGE